MPAQSPVDLTRQPGDTLRIRSNTLRLIGYAHTSLQSPRRVAFKCFVYGCLRYCRFIASLRVQSTQRANQRPPCRWLE